MDPIEPWVDRDELRRLADCLLAAPAPEPMPSSDAAYGDEFEGYAAKESGDSGRPPSPPAERGRGDSDPLLTKEAGATAGPAPEMHARRALATAREIAQRGGLLKERPLPPTPAAEPALEPPDEPEGPPQLTHVAPLPPATGAALPTASTPFLARLQAYGAWLQDGLRATAFFVLDREGGVLIDEVHSPKLQQVARTLAQASRTANRQAGAAAIGSLHVKIAPDAVLEVVPVLSKYGPLILGITVPQPLSTHNVETVARGLQQVVDGAPDGVPA